MKENQQLFFNVKKGDLFFNIDYDTIHLLGGAADGGVLTVKKGISKVTLNTLHPKAKLAPFMNVSHRPLFVQVNYHRLAETNIFYCPDNTRDT